MTQQFNKLFILAFLFSGITACQQSKNTEQVVNTEPHSAELIINLVSDATASAHSSLMGLHLGQNALKNEIPVTVFLNVNGVKLMSPGADTLSFQDENLHALLKAMISDGAQVLACPHCMEVEGIEESNLIEGVKVSNEELMMPKIKASPTVFTY